MTSPVDPSLSAEAARVRRRFWKRPWVILSLASPIILAGALTWLFASESGLRVACVLVESLTHGQVQLEQPRGSLAGPWTLKALRLQTLSSELEIVDIDADWQLSALLRGVLRVDRLAAGSARFASQPAQKAPEIPQMLALPIELDIRRLTLGRFISAPFKPAQKTAGSVVILESLSAGLHVSRDQYRLDNLRLQAAQLQVAGSAELDTQAPFQLRARAVAKGEVKGETTGESKARAFTVAVSATGPLQQIEIRGTAEGEAVHGNFQTSITPFKSQVIGNTVAQLQGIDPAGWLSQAPHAVLDINVTAAPVAGEQDSFRGQFGIRNAKPGRLDEQLLPVLQLNGNLHWKNNVLSMDSLLAEFPGGGKLRGSGNFARQQLELVLEAERLDVAMLHGKLKPTQLNGPLKSTLSLHRQQLDLDLADRRFAIQTAVTLAYPELTIDSLRLTRGNASLRLAGRLSLAENKAINLSGRLENFDPGVFANVPAARLNADVEASGNLGDGASLNLQFAMAQSEFGGEPLSGAGKLRYEDGNLPEVDAHLVAGQNRMVLRGAWGKPGESLAINVNAPRLDPYGMQGDVTAQLELSGSFAAPSLQGKVSSERLEIPNVIRLKGLQFEGALGLSAGSPAKIQFQLAQADLAGLTGRLEALALTVDGTREQHRISASGRLVGQFSGIATANGGFREAAKPGSAGWTGTLSQLVLSPMGLVSNKNPLPLLSLAAPVPVSWTSEAFELGAAELRGAQWSAQIARLDRRQGLWSSRGTLRQFPVNQLTSTPQSTLTMAAEWDMSLGNELSGRLHIQRDAGDITVAGVGNDSASIGLQTARLDIDVVEGRLRADLHVAGSRLGDVSGKLTATMGSALQLDKHAPWQGELSVRMPDISWMALLLGEGTKLGGELEGGLVIAGTPSAPTLNGKFTGSKLSVLAGSQGTSLRDGKLLVDLQDEKLLVRQLAFESAYLQAPPGLASIARGKIAELVKQPGRLDVQGELRFRDEGGRLDIHLDRVGVLQRTDQWVVVSGDSRLELEKGVLGISGKLRADAAWWELAKKSTVSLSDDVVYKPRDGAAEPVRQSVFRTRLDLDFATGDSAYFRGAGLESRLSGSIKLTSEPHRPLQANGTIQSVDGRFDAYGQNLAIERGILNFRGLVDNPGLNVRALRKNLPVEAGVEISGTVKKPVVRLVSEPNVPDVEKLSWLVQGRAPSQQKGQDSALLLAAASSILGGQDKSLGDMRRTLGIDEFGISSGTIGGQQGNTPTSSVASSGGLNNSESSSSQIVSVGKRLSDKAVLSYEQSMSTTESIVKLTVTLPNRLYLVAQTGSENALDIFYTYRFGK